MDEQGTLHEKVYDVVWSGDRKPDKDGKVPPVGNTVDVKEAIWTNTIGSTELITGGRTLTSIRSSGRSNGVIEIPTPRWTAYDAKYFLDRSGSKIPMDTQERAYTSPIWTRHEAEPH